MKGPLFFLLTALFSLWLTAFSWAQCSTPNDLGECDTFYLECYNPVQFDPPPWEIYFPFLVTHDVADFYIDSIFGIYVPFEISHTNASAYCSISSWRNLVSYVPSDSARSVFRHLGGMQNRMMDLYEQGSGGEWNSRIISTQYPYFRITAGKTAEDQAWWESSRTLFATMTLLVSDTMTIGIQCAPWPPDDIVNVLFCRGDYRTYRPSQNLPFSIKISYMPRGDANGDRVIDVADVVFMINYLFRSGPEPVCSECGDANCDNDHNIGDVVWLINYLYKNGPAPACP